MLDFCYVLGNRACLYLFINSAEERKMTQQTNTQEAPEISDKRYIEIVAKRVGAKKEDVATALKLCGKEIGKIRLFMRHITVVARRVNAPTDDVIVARIACGRNIKAIRNFLQQNRGCGSYA